MESICLEIKSFQNEAVVTLTESPDFDLGAEDASDGNEFQLQILCDDGECFEGTVEDKEDLIEEFSEYLTEKGVFDKN